MLDSLLAKGEQLQKLIGKHRSAFGSVVRPILSEENTLKLNLSDPDNFLAKVDPNDAEFQWRWLERRRVELEGLEWGVGRQGHTRVGHERYCLHVLVERRVLHVRGV